MARYLLDSNAVIAALKGQPAALLNRLARLPPERLCLSSIVLGELLTGVEKSRDPARHRMALDILAQGMVSVPFGADEARTYAGIRATLERQGLGIGPLDTQIAAQCLHHRLILVTANLREFRRVPDLICENWMT